MNLFLSPEREQSKNKSSRFPKTPRPAYIRPMITAIIETQNDEVGLAHALAALVPAATEGVVREVIVVDRGSQDGTLVVADTAGCTIVEAAKVSGEAVRYAAEGARGDWLLFLEPSAALVPGWQSAAMAFIDRALVTGRAQSRVARVRKGSLSAGWLSWLLGLVSRGDGYLVAKTAYLAASVSSSPASSVSTVSGARRGVA
jgi:cellulose synthase/poly-beta-1,6-N-acetylglucosamine synthase-like glycosyltransferase